MSRLRKFLELTPTTQGLLTRALVLVALIRIALWVLPFRMLGPLLTRCTSNPTGGRHADGALVDRTAWAVAVVARYVPRATCLTQALAAQVLLAREGEASKLHIGVARDQRGGVRAHAWLEHRGRIVIGGASANDFVPLSLLPERGSRAKEWATG